jgi:hypothetical protein
MLACAWLLERGYAVFRNVCPDGDIDIVAIRGDETLLLDIKWHEKNLIKAQLDRGVRALYVKKDRTCEIRESLPRKRCTTVEPVGMVKTSPTDARTRASDKSAIIKSRIVERIRGKPDDAVLTDDDLAYMLDCTVKRIPRDVPRTVGEFGKWYHEIIKPFRPLK